MPLQESAKVLSNKQVKPGYYLMELEAPRIAAEARPGQFIHARVGNTLDPLLRRPISLYGINPQVGALSLLYVVVGRGTKILSETLPGASLDIMGPLGTGFRIPEGVTRALVVGGGIGVAPLFPVVEMLREKNIEQKVLYGFRNAEAVVGTEKVAALGLSVAIATDNGSAGRQGFVTELVKEALAEFQPDYYYTCGPEVMIKNVVRLMQEKGIDGQVSLEARMGCGVGACLACTCKTKKAGGQEPDYAYSLVCTHGPVFDAGEVIFDE